jgi:hypothetical protein
VTVRRLLVAVLGVGAMAFAACGDGPSSSAAAKDDGDPVAAAQDRLAEVDRATIDVRFVASAGDGDTSGKDVGFALEGPFQLPEDDGDLPVASLTSTRMLGDHDVETRFVSNGERAWVLTDDGGKKVVELQGQQLDALRGSTKASGADLTALHLSDWFATKKTTTSGDTVTVTGTLDAPTAIADVLALSGAAGTDPLDAADAERLRQLVRSSSVKLVADRDDHTLRTLHFDVRFAPEDQPKLAEVLPQLAGVDLRLDLALHDVGKDVEVEAPAGT